MSNQSESRNKGTSLRLVAHIKDKEEASRLLALWAGSEVLFNKTIRKVLEDKLQESYRAIDDEEVYKIPNVAGYLADQCGYRRAIKEILSLLPTSN